MMLAFAIMSVVLGGVVIADFSAQYWIINSQTSNEGLYNAKTKLEDLRATAQQNFYDASSMPVAKIADTACASGGLCYFVQTVVTDLSPCSKYAQALVSWQVQRYPTTTTSLSTNLTYPAEAVNEGGDCPLNTPAGSWLAATPAASPYAVSGNPSSIDVLGGIAYIGTNQSPYLAIADTAGSIPFQNGFALPDAVDAIDVARDAATGRTYAYLAMASTTRQFAIVDVSDSKNPVLVAATGLSATNTAGSEGWRIFYYKQKVYLTVRYTLPGKSELYVFDVSNPTTPVEVSNKSLGTSVYGIVVRDYQAGNTTSTLAYVATTYPSKELMVWDVTNSASMSELIGATTNIPGVGNCLSVFLLGDTLYLGCSSSLSQGPDLFALNASDPLSATGGLSNTVQPVTVDPSAGINRHVGAIRASGPFLYIYTANTTNSSGALEVRDSTTLSLVSGSTPYLIMNPAETALDLDGAYLYVANTAPSQLNILKSI
ncbi:MAG: hypothetical protein Q7R71_00865 [bacterium]|nr:hypothetical protein [bacterium]